MSEDRDTEIMLVADVALKALSVSGRLARRAGCEDLADECEQVLARMMEVIDLEQAMKGRTE